MDLAVRQFELIDKCDEHIVAIYNKFKIVQLSAMNSSTRFDRLE